MYASAACMLVAMVVSGPGDTRLAAHSGRARTARIEGCLVSTIADIEVPAQEAGVLLDLAVEEGDEVIIDQMLGKIDDRRSQIEQVLAESELRAAEKAASDDVSVRLASNAAKVAQYDYETAEDANTRGNNVIPKTEVLRRKFEWLRADLSTDKARLDQDIARDTRDAKKAAVDAAVHGIERRQIKSPIEGRVKEVAKHKGEWVQAGDTVLRLVGLNKLRLKGGLDATQFRHADVLGKPATVEALLPGANSPIELQGVVRHVDPEVSGDGVFQVWIDFDNEKDVGDWLMFPGMHADVIIHLDEPSAVSARR